MRSLFARPRWTIAAVLFAAAIAPREAGCQEAQHRISAGAYGGFAQSAPLPSPTTGAVGYSAGLLAQLQTPIPLLHLRADLFTASWGEQRQHFRAGTLGAAAVLPLSGVVQPYLVAAGGAFTAPGASTSRGWLLGLGAEFPIGRRRLMIESRMYSFLAGEEAATRAAGGFGGPADPWRYSYAPLLIGFRF